LGAQVQRKHQDPDHEGAPNDINNNLIEFRCGSGSPLTQEAKGAFTNGEPEQERKSCDTQRYQESVPVLFDKRDTKIH